METKYKIQTSQLIILISSLLVVIVNAIGDESIVRNFLNVWFLMVCPGLAFVHLLHLSTLWIEFTLAVALSLALDGLVGGIMIYTYNWFPQIAMIVLLILSLSGVLLDQLGIDLSKSNNNL